MPPPYALSWPGSGPLLGLYELTARFSWSLHYWCPPVWWWNVAQYGTGTAWTDLSVASSRHSGNCLPNSAAAKCHTKPLWWYFMTGRRGRAAPSLVIHWQLPQESPGSSVRCTCAVVSERSASLTAVRDQTCLQETYGVGGERLARGPLEPQENDGEPSDGYTWDRGSAEKGCEVFAGQRTPRLRLFRTAGKERQLSVHRDAGKARGNTHPNALSNLRQWDLIQFPDLMDYSALA